MAESQIDTRVQHASHEYSSIEASTKNHLPMVSPTTKDVDGFECSNHNAQDAPLFNDSFWKDVAKTKREIKFLSKELEKKKHILAVYYEGVRQYFEEEDVMGGAE